MAATSFPLVSVDIGNSRLKFARSDTSPQLGIGKLPAPARTLDLLRDRADRHDRPVRDVTLISAGDLPLVVSLPQPDMVGIDRLLGAVAANEVRDPARPAIVVDLGSAITVDLVAADGAFRGGAILPGIGMSARALHEFTDLLPLIEMHALAEPPSPVGNATVPAMTS